MSLLIAIGLGTVLGIGLLLVVMGVRKTEVQPGSPTRGILGRLRATDQLNLRIGLGLGAAIVLWFLAFWPIAIVMAFLGGFVAPTLVGAKKRRQQAVALTEAVATWAEQLRDIIGSAAGLNEAISATSGVAPKPIRPQVQLIARGLRYESLPVLLRRFAASVDDPAADQIAASLILASERRGQNLTELLNEVAEGAREEASMRMRTETSRAQTYADAKAVTLIVLTVFGLLLLTNRGYLSAFDSVVGQLILGGVGLMWAGAIQGLAGLARVRRPVRVLAVNHGGRR